MRAPEPSFDHLARLTTPLGVFEHARLTTPRPEHGFCLDDAARALVVTARHGGGDAARVYEVVLRFVLDAQAADGRFVNRRSRGGAWVGRPGTGDHWGRALWALGTVLATTTDDRVREHVLDAASRACERRSPSPRAMAYAALGAAEVVRTRPDEQRACRLLADAATLLGRPDLGPGWPWAEARLAYANAALPEGLLAAGAGLGDDRLLAVGLRRLEWLLEQETRDGRLSVTPVGGRGPGDRGPGFDQQPIEVTALAEACWRAVGLTRDRRWLTAMDMCVDWFLGGNDAGAPVYDADTGGGHDGLHVDGVNANQGAESTLAALATFQLARQAVAEPVR